MWQLFNIVTFLGRDYDWDAITAITTMMFIQLALTLFCS